MRADAMLEAGDLDGYAVWKRVVKAVEELLSTERPPGSTVAIGSPPTGQHVRKIIDTGTPENVGL